MSAIITLDLGTTYFKAALFDRQGQLFALHREAPPIEHSTPEQWELPPDQFRETVIRAIAQLAIESPTGLGEVVAISFATQTNSFVLFDEHDRPLTPIILWPDGRATGMSDAIDDLAALPRFQEITGVPKLSHEFMAAKLAWLQTTDPGLWSRARRVCLLSDYLTLWLTGRHVTEAAAASLTGLLDVRQLRWWSPACDCLGLPEEWLGEVVRGGTDLGTIRPEAADELGLPRSCRFVVGCLDQYAGAIGTGNIRPGGVSETTGTVLATVRCSNTMAAGAGGEIYQGPGVEDGVYYQMVFGSTSANLLEWYNSRLPNSPGFEELDRRAALIPPGSEGVRVRYRADQGDLAAGFIGTDPVQATGHAARAIMEAVAFALADQVDRLCGSQRPGEIRSSGGAARSRVWLQIKADVLGTEFAANACPEPTSLGAALLAARACGWGTMEELARQWVHTQEPCRPDLTRHEIYQAIRTGYSVSLMKGA